MVRWCPGCGDYAILQAILKTLPKIGQPPQNHVFISGIGCAGRLPYYMNAYGFHTIHGRALSVATGLSIMREDLTVWVITGDGDALSIGGNHFIHTLRRNVNINILLLNNQVYGLTKGQFSPTSVLKQKTKTSPEGVSTRPINPLSLALSCDASFVGRSIDKDPVHLAEVLYAAYQHHGTSFIEIYQDCNIFNKGAFDSFSLKNNRSSQTLKLANNQPLAFADASFLNITKDSFITADQALASIHNQTDLLQATALARLEYPKFPVPIGILYQTQKKTFGVKKPLENQDLNSLYRKKAIWQV